MVVFFPLSVPTWGNLSLHLFSFQKDILRRNVFSFSGSRTGFLSVDVDIYDDADVFDDDDVFDDEGIEHKSRIYLPSKNPDQNLLKGFFPPASPAFMNGFDSGKPPVPHRVGFERIILNMLGARNTCTCWTRWRIRRTFARSPPITFFSVSLKFYLFTYFSFSFSLCFHFLSSFLTFFLFLCFFYSACIWIFHGLDIFLT